MFAKVHMKGKVKQCNWKHCFLSYNDARTQCPHAARSHDGHFPHFHGKNRSAYLQNLELQLFENTRILAME